MKKTNFVKDALILFVITLISGALLGLVYEITLEPIQATQEQAKQDAYREVLADAASFEDVADIASLIESSAAALTEGGYGTVDHAVNALDSSGNVIGYVINASSTGFGGAIQISVGIANDGTVGGIAFLSISETAGLGMNAKNESFYSQFAGKNVDAFEVTKSGATSDNEIDALSGATITSNAVANAVNTAIYFKQNYLYK